MSAHVSLTFTDIVAIPLFLSCLLPLIFLMPYFPIFLSTKGLGRSLRNRSEDNLDNMITMKSDNIRDDVIHDEKDVDIDNDDDDDYDYENIIENDDNNEDFH